jgi:putative transposase
MVTASTLHKEKLFNTEEKLDYLERELLEMLTLFGWRVQAWAVFSNRYHFVGLAPENPDITALINRLHGRTSHGLNGMDGIQGRQVWFQYRDSALTYQKSYLARLSYVHRNAVKHGLVTSPEDYRWCSARWFRENATKAQSETIMNLPIDGVNVEDDF